MGQTKTQNNESYIKKVIQKSGANIDSYFTHIKQDVKKAVLSFHNVKFNLVIKTIFSKPLAMEDKIERHFNSGNIRLNAINEFNALYNSIVKNYKVWEEEHQGKESGLIFYEIKNTTVRVFSVNRLNGSSYFDLGIKLNSLLNIQNKDNKCFAYSVIAGILYKLKENPDNNKKYSTVFKKMEKKTRKGYKLQTFSRNA